MILPAVVKDPGYDAEVRLLTETSKGCEPLFEVELRYYELRAKGARLIVKEAELEAARAERDLLEARLKGR